MAEDPYKDPVTGVLYNKLGLETAAELETAERALLLACLMPRKEISHAPQPQPPRGQ